VESRDGLHGLAVWALAVVLGSILAALVGASTLSRSSPPAANASAAEPVLSYELDRLYRSVRRPPNVDLSYHRAEAGRILLTSSSHDGMSADDRALPYPTGSFGNRSLPCRRRAPGRQRHCKFENRANPLATQYHHPGLFVSVGLAAWSGRRMGRGMCRRQAPGWRPTSGVDGTFQQIRTQANCPPIAPTGRSRFRGISWRRRWKFGKGA
jgi:hypothetical protein